MTGVVYFVGFNAHLDGRRADSVYLPPVVVQAQNKVNYSLVARAIRHGLNILEDTRSPSVLVVISSERCSSKEYRDGSFVMSDSDLFYTRSCPNHGRNRFSCIPQIELLSTLTCTQWIR